MFPQEMFRGTNKLPKADMAMSIENCVPASGQLSRYMAT
jgi:hypothetical protein